MKQWCFFLLSLPLAAQFQGTVVNRDTQGPIEGARVRIQYSDTFVLSGPNGEFTLNDTAPFPLTLTAAAYNYFIGSTVVNSAAGRGSLQIELDPISLNITADHPLNPPEACSTCHPNQYAEWLNMPMAKTGLNSWVFDVYDGNGTAGGMNGFVYQRDSVHRLASPNSDCSACHSPVHWLTDIETAGMGNIAKPNPDMQRGVQCEVCHRAYDVDENRLNYPGVDPEAFTFLRGDQNLEFGLIDDVTYENQIMRAAYNPLLSARLCAACHEDNVDHDDDGDFEDEGSVPHESTYSEWQQYRQALGSQAKTCVECHMPAKEEARICIFGEDRPPKYNRSHDIRGTTEAFLDHAVTMSMEWAMGLGYVDVDIDIVNDQTGHSVPSGVVIRNMLLVLQVRDHSGQELVQMTGDQVDFIGGSGSPEQGYYAGLAGKSFYLNMTDGVNQGIFYTEATAVVADTRLKPGETYNGSFRFEWGAQFPTEIDVDARLIYRRSFRSLLDEKGWTLTGHDEPLEDIQAPHFGHLMERSTVLEDSCSAAVVAPLRDQLLPLWGADTPIQPELGALTSVRHLTSLTNCL